MVFMIPESDPKIAPNHELAQKINQLLQAHSRKSKLRENGVLAMQRGIALYGESRIRGVITWLETAIADRYTPKFDSVKSFIQRFAAIEQSMFKARLNQEFRSAIISKQARLVKQYLITELDWSPLGQDIKLLTPFVEYSLKNWRVFRKSLQKITGQNDNNSAAFAEVVLHKIWGTGVYHGGGQFGRWWGELVYRRTHARVYSLQDWIFTPQHELFDRRAAQWAIEYTGRCTAWLTLLSKIQESAPAMELLSNETN